ncbi:MAG: ABC transporter substrate-binding protein [Blastocatellia bacterium]|nr:ABC transporter substrate-binding protein [Blastocatellia bacterium]
MNSATTPGAHFPPAIILMGLMVSLLMCGCGRGSEPEVRVGTHVWPGYETLFLAREKGFFGETAIRLLELPSASESIRAFENGSVDVAALTMDEALRLAARGLEPRIILIMDFSNGADVILARPEIRDLRGLKGRSIGVESNALGAYMLSRGLDSVGMQTSEVRLVPLLIPETETAYLQGRVDAVVTFEPYRSRLLGAGARMLFDSRRIPNEIADVMIVRRDFLDKAPRGLRRLVAGHFLALDRLTTDREEAAQVMALREQVSPANFLASLEGLRLPDRAENRQLLGPGKAVLVEAMSRLQQEMRKHGILQTESDPSILLDDRFVREVAP